jgi:hypothetical protein
MVDGDKLLAREKQVDPKFNEARQAGKFKKRSAAFYTDETGKITGLRHVAYLGAQPPEVKGLHDVAFDDRGSGFITVDFGEDGTVADKTFAEQFKEAFANLLGLNGNNNSAPKTFSEDDLKRIAAEAAAPLQAKVTALENDLAAQRTQFAEREKALAGGEVKQRATEAITRLKSKGKWIPAFDKQGLPLVFDELAKITASIEFGEGEQKKKATALETLVLFMESAPSAVPAGRLVTGAVPSGAGRHSGDPLTDAAKVLAREKGLKFGEALTIVSSEHPEWTGAGAAVGGQV